MNLQLLHIRHTNRARHNYFGTPWSCVLLFKENRRSWLRSGSSKEENQCCYQERCHRSLCNKPCPCVRSFLAYLNEMQSFKKAKATTSCFTCQLHIDQIILVLNGANLQEMHILTSVISFHLLNSNRMK